MSIKTKSRRTPRFGSSSPHLRYREGKELTIIVLSSSDEEEGGEVIDVSSFENEWEEIPNHEAREYTKRTSQKDQEIPLHKEELLGKP